MARWLRSLRVRLALLVVIALASVVFGATAAQAATVTGTVTDASTFEPVPGPIIEVYYDAGDGSYGYFGWLYGEADGTYAYPYLDPGLTYIFAFSSWGYGTEYFEDAPDESSATQFTCTADDDSFVANPALDFVGFSIGGTVTSSAGPPMGDVSVMAYAFEDFYWYAYAGDWTDPFGRYQIDGLPDGEYRLLCSDPYNGHGDKWYDTNVQVVAGVPQFCDITLMAPPFIAGTITDATTELPVEGVEAYAYTLIDDGWDVAAVSEPSDDQGRYVISGVEPGTEYKIGFYDTNYLYAEQYYDGAGYFGQATAVEAKVEGVGEIDAALVPWELNYGTVSGRVTDQTTTDSIPFAQVDFYTDQGNGWEYWDWAEADESGEYSYSLWSGQYKVGFRAGDYGDEYYLESASLATAMPVDVTYGQTLPDIDGTLLPWDLNYGTIAGTVTDADTLAPIADASVSLFEESPWGWEWAGYVDYANESGEYSIEAQAGRYLVEFSAEGIYLTEYWNDAATTEEALPIDLAAGASQTLDAQLTPDFGTVTGTITDEATGLALGSGYVTAWKYDAQIDYWYEWRSQYVDEEGTYSMRLPQGTWRLSFSDGWGYHYTEFYNDQPSVDLAEDLVIGLGEGVVRNAALTPIPPSISGAVTETGSGNAIESAFVEALAPVPGGGYDVYAWDYTDESGDYGLYFLGSGDYIVQFDSFNHVPMYYNGQPTIETADYVTTSDGVETPGINAVLDPRAAATIQGTVAQYATPKMLAGIQVRVYYQTVNGNEVYDVTTTDYDGTYSVSVQSGRTYALEFVDDEYKYASEWYKDADDWSSAIWFSLGDDEIYTADAELTKYATISGTISDAETSKPLSWAGANLYRADGMGGWEYTGGTNADFLGRYSMTATPGTYKVGFYGPGAGTYLGEWWQDAADEADAIQIEVWGSEDIKDINGTLTPNYGTLSGRITEDGTGDPIWSGGVTVWSYDEDAAEWIEWDWADADEDGYYSIKLGPGTYKVSFDDWTGKHVTEFFDDQATLDTAEDVQVVAGAALTRDAALAVSSASISGKVTDADTLAGIEYPYVEAYAYIEDWDYWEVSGWSESAEDGTYGIWGLGSGSYAVYFSAYGYVGSYYDGQSKIGTANLVETTAGDTVTDVDAALVPRTSGTIYGVVTGSDTGLGIPEVEVYAVKDSEEGWDWVDSTFTDDQGEYTLGLEATADYVLHFWDSNLMYLPEYYDDVQEPDLTTPLTVSPDSTTEANAVLTKGATVSGTVTAGAAHLQGIEVAALVYNPEWGWGAEGSTATDVNGDYTITGLPAGDYVIAFVDWTNGRYVSEYWDDAVDPDSATPVTLAASEDKSGISADLAPAGRILGRVTTAGGAGIGDIQVEAYSPDGFGGWNAAGFGWTEGNGDYFIGSLPTGSYRLYFYDGWWGDPRYADEYYNDVADLAFATDVEVVAGSDTTGINAALASTGTWGSISGTIRDATTSAALRGGAELYEADWWGWQSVDFTDTTPDGAYRFDYLDNGEYTVGAYVWGAAYDVGYHLDASKLIEADMVVVDGGAVADVDVLVNGVADSARISGTVTADDGGAPIENATVQVYRYFDDEEFQGWDLAAESRTNASGEYSIALEAGSEYKVKFEAPPYATEWYEDAPTMGSATPIVLTPAGDYTADAGLALGGTLSGAVTGANPDSWVEIRLWKQVGEDREIFRDWSDTDAESYLIEGIPAGTYFLEYRGWAEDSSFAQMFYGDAYHLSAATPITFAGGEDLTRDVALEIGGSIYLTLLTDDGELGWRPVTAVLWLPGPDGYEPYREEQVWADWGWIDNLPAATDYILQVTDPLGTYEDIWYPASPTIVDAESVEVVAGDDSPVEITLDALPPALSDDLASPYNDSATINLSATDEVVGVQSISYTLDDDDTVTLPQSTASVTTNIPGEHTLVYSASDLLGHSDSKTITFVVKDTIAPTPTDNAVSSYANTGTINLSGTDAVGVTKIEYKFDTAESWTTINAATAVASVPYGATSLTYKVYDAADNAASKTVDFTVTDTIAPAVTTDNKSTYYGSAAVKITATDSASGVQKIEYRVNGETTQTATGSSVTISKSASSSYTVKYCAYDSAGNKKEGQLTFTIVPAVLTTVPLEGPNRYETAIEIATKAHAKSDYVVLATGENWPDALGGAALAKAYEAPILLVRTNSVPAEVMTALAQLQTKNVIVLGGKAAVSGEVETALKAKYGFERIGGDNRYHTSRLIAARVSSRMGSAFEGDAFIATGKNFPDALAGSPISAAKGWPIYLVGDSVSAAEMNTIKGQGVKDLVILGGTGVVNTGVEDALKAQFGGAAHVRRKAGANRYETAVKVASMGVAECGLAWNKLALATGTNFPDALAGGVLQGKDGSVMLLTPSTSLDANVSKVLTTNKATIYEVRFLGGTGAINTTVRNKVKAILAK